MSNTKKAKAELMSEDAFKEAVLPMLEQAYKQGYEEGYAAYKAELEDDGK